MNGAIQGSCGRIPFLATIFMPIEILKERETSQVKLSLSYHFFIAFEDFDGQASIPAIVIPDL